MTENGREKDNEEARSFLSYFFRILKWTYCWAALVPRHTKKATDIEFCTGRFTFGLIKNKSITIKKNEMKKARIYDAFLYYGS